MICGKNGFAERFSVNCQLTQDEAVELFSVISTVTELTVTETYTSLVFGFNVRGYEIPILEFNCDKPSVISDLWLNMDRAGFTPFDTQEFREFISTYAEDDVLDLRYCFDNADELAAALHRLVHQLKYAR